MNLLPINQLELFGFQNEFNELIDLYEKKKLPNKILLSGQKGLGKSTLAYHLINFILSKGENFPYDLDNLTINDANRSHQLILNSSHQNFILVDINQDKKYIDINQVRELISKLNKSSFNEKPRFILIDNIEYLNLNSVNALLKVLEEPNENIFFILINNNKKIIPTLKSRCLNFRLSLSNEKTFDVAKKLLENDVYDCINKNFINYYLTPGNIYNLIKFCKKNDLDLINSDLKQILTFIIDENIYKKETTYKYVIYNLIETFLSKKKSVYDLDTYSYFLKQINHSLKYNLDEEVLFMEFKMKVLNG